jgi:phosphocarrier protein
VIEREATIVTQDGLHARPAAKIVRLASTFSCEVELFKDGMAVNAKSIMGVMMLAAGKGAKVTIEIEGPDESDAMDAIVSLIGDCFGEGQ